MALLAAPPDVLRWSPRSAGHGDCAISALELACGVSYETALAAAVALDPDVLSLGLTLREMMAIARKLGFRSRLRRKFDVDEDTGIMSVVQPHVKGSDHVVYLWAGRVVEPKDDRRQLWLDAQQFLDHYRYKAYGLVVLAQD